MVFHLGLNEYWQVEIDEKDRPETAFTTGDGLFEFRVMPFGLCNVPAVFQRLMDLVLPGICWEHCLVYIDDIVIMGKTFKNHMQNLRIALEKLRGAGLLAITLVSGGGERRNMWRPMAHSLPLPLGGIWPAMIQNEYCET